jgi:hypothetical protein
MSQNLMLQGFSSNPLIRRTLCSNGIAMEPDLGKRTRTPKSGVEICCEFDVFLVNFQRFFTNIVFWIT